MTTKNLTLSEWNWINGNCYTSLVINDGIVEDSVTNIIIDVGQEDVILKTARLTGGIAYFTWEFFEGAEYTLSPGTDVGKFPLNYTQEKTAYYKVINKPTITTVGVSITGKEILNLGFNGSYGRSKLDDQLLDDMIKLKKDVNYLLRIKSLHAGSIDLQAKFSFYV